MAEKEKPQRASRYSIKLIGQLTPERLVHERESTGEACLCNTVNISASGALVETSGIFMLGSLLKYSIRIPGIKKPVDIMAEVVRREGEEYGSGSTLGANRDRILRYGIRFIDISDRDRAVVEGFLRG